MKANERALTVRTLISAGLTVMIAACGGGGESGGNGASVQTIGGAGTRPTSPTGAVYVMTNEAAGNGVAVFARAVDGTVALQGTVATGGLGVGALSDSQDALILNEDHTLLFAANPGSDEITVFGVSTDGLELTEVQRIASGGDRPVSLTTLDDSLYVLNSGSEGNITGFAVGEDGRLTPLAGSTQPLSTSEFIPWQRTAIPSGEYRRLQRREPRRG